MDIDGFALRRRDAAAVLTMRGEVEPIYVAANTGRIAADPFSHPDRFWQRLADMYSRAPGFDFVGGYVDDQLIGYAFGCTRTADRSVDIWKEIRTALPGFPVPPETQPVFIFNEFAVDPTYQNRGYGRRIMDRLLGHRSELVANLFVRPDNPARDHYRSWGWLKIAEKKPFPDSPTFESLIKDLRTGECA
ncbi:GNAT family N-acetyltransferase [Dactylosporangium sp. NPDC051541]|uniref:GNAT family N-acetyltransferase n=1 Tax=Dactylosporangium sp. NPDC051541 TaxID=3363977 RepID=UPI0037BA61AA